MAKPVSGSGGSDYSHRPESPRSGASSNPVKGAAERAFSDGHGSSSTHGATGGARWTNVVDETSHDAAAAVSEKDVTAALSTIGLTAEDAAALPGQVDKAITEVKKNPNVSQAVKDALNKVHEFLKNVWTNGLAPFFAGLATAGTIPLKITAAALSLAILPIVALAKAFVIVATQCTGKPRPEALEKADLITDAGLLLAFVSAVEFHPKSLHIDAQAFHKLFTGIPPEKVNEEFILARGELIKATLKAMLGREERR